MATLAAVLISIVVAALAAIGLIASTSTAIDDGNTDAAAR